MVKLNKNIVGLDLTESELIQGLVTKIENMIEANVRINKCSNEVTKFPDKISQNDKEFVKRLNDQNQQLLVNYLNYIKIAANKSNDLKTIYRNLATYLENSKFDFWKIKRILLKTEFLHDIKEINLTYIGFGAKFDEDSIKQESNGYSYVLFLYSKFKKTEYINYQNNLEKFVDLIFSAKKSIQSTFIVVDEGF